MKLKSSILFVLGSCVFIGLLFAPKEVIGEHPKVWKYYTGTNWNDSEIARIELPNGQEVSLNTDQARMILAGRYESGWYGKPEWLKEGLNH